MELPFNEKAFSANPHLIQQHRNLQFLFHAMPTQVRLNNLIVEAETQPNLTIHKPYKPSLVS